MKFHKSDNPSYIAEVIGLRLKRARLNRDMTQVEVADRAWVSKRTVLKAEKGDVRLADLIAILRALEMLDEINSFLPEPPLSPIELLKLRGKIRKRASGNNKNKTDTPNLGW
ncbi:helix-turn-helix domain-containing protein [Acinetobacter sp. FDAARGOS_724]|uniref:helix-turn-helix domain-containing protein n=1 Tax=Acinetobacter sp. FDAARGOS_724 TaxID=2545797 RepID=UPI001589CCBD|nr:helix-turn-helix transcriptional regulator [Acinetobacter sp. FDAARGOS_724]QKW83479.1 helix-turn-helix domain-containing protein [Acinetobacter sp. FDAARGOS_724]